MVFNELKRFVVEKLGPEAWNTLLVQAGLEGRTYLPRATYPDTEAVALVTAASKVTGRPAGDILEDFGLFISGDLLAMYSAHLDPSWDALDVIEHTEETVHRVVRMKTPGAAPPGLRSQRPSKDEVIVFYDSGRHMCGLAKGIVRGIAAHYKEEVQVREPTCMLSGAPRCEIHVSRVG